MIGLEISVLVGMAIDDHHSRCSDDNSAAAALLSSVSRSKLSNVGAYVSTQLVSQFRYTRRLILSFCSELYKLQRICY